MGVSLSWSISVTNDSATQSTVTVTLKATTSGSSYNNSSPSGYITIGGTKYTFSHNIPKSKTTTLATKSKAFSRVAGAQSIAIKASFSTGISAGTLTKSGTATVPSLDVYGVYWYWGSLNSNALYTSTSVYYSYAATHPSISATGYTFNGWNGAYAAGTSTGGIYGTTAYTASWTPITYSISYDLAGGSLPDGVTNPTSYTIQTAAQYIHRPVREGYHFVGWTGSNGTTPQGGDSEQNEYQQPAGLTGNRTYTANWEINKYKVYLNPENHNFPSNWEWPDDSIHENNTYMLYKTHGVNLPLPNWGVGDNDKGGIYQLFAGWEYTPSGSSSAVSTGVSYERDGSTHEEEVTLKAHWSSAVRSIFLHYSDSNTVDNQTVVYQPFNMATTLPTKSISNYAFKGWSLSRNGTIKYSTSTSMTVTNFNDWFFATEDTVVDGEKAYYTKSGTETYTLAELEPDTDIPTGTTYYEMNNNPVAIHLYAIWNPTYMVVFNRNDPSCGDGLSPTGSVASKTVENGVSFSLPSAGYSRTGYTVAGWATSATGAVDSNYAAGKTIIISGQAAGYVLNLYAVWTKRTYSITFRRNGASGSDKTISSLPYWSSYTLPSSKTDSRLSWTYANYNLSGWQHNGTTTIVKPGTSIIVNQTLTYNAQWSYLYNVPTGVTIDTHRYLDAGYTTLNNGGKYLKIHAIGVNGSYQGVTVSEYTYEVDVKFYNTSNVSSDIRPVATYTLYLTSPRTSTNSFEQTWGVPARPLVDKGLNMAYCVLSIKDTTFYSSDFSADNPDRTIAFEFPVVLERAIALHIADDVSAISMFDELKSTDKGLVVHNQATITGSLSAGATTMNGNSTVNGDLALNGDLTTLNNLKLKFLVDPAANKTKAATSGEDMALFNWVRNLGWWDVIIE